MGFILLSYSYVMFESYLLGSYKTQVVTKRRSDHDDYQLVDHFHRLNVTINHNFGSILSLFC